MRPFRKPLLRRTTAVVLLIIFLQSLAPQELWALTVGPHQPEYTSYEEPGATDMVNTLTGDFSYNLPILEVPGPEGGFSLPLTYNAGIGLEQEASWVGLGWSLNAGAITRVTNEYPDDANGEGNSVTAKDLIGLRGWDAMLPGIGKFGWNNQTGHSGSVSLLSIVNAEWTEGSTSVGVAGINVTSDGLYFDPVQMAMAAATIVSMGIATAEITVAKAVAEGIAVGAALDVGITGATGGLSSPSAPQSGAWAYDRKGVNIGVYKKYKIWLDKTRYEDMYGILYLGNTQTSTYTSGPDTYLVYQENGTTKPLERYYNDANGSTVNKGSASDINYVPDVFEESLEFQDINNPVMLATDNFSVKAPGISGNISPYRLEIGSVAMPRAMTSSHIKFAPVKYLSDYKVPFIYDGQVANSYFHHVGGATAVSSPQFYFGITATPSTAPGGSPATLTYAINDVAVDPGNRIDADIPVSRQIPQGNHIEWLTNAEIKNSSTYPSRFMDFLSGAGRTDFRSLLASSGFSAYSSTQSLSSTINTPTVSIPVGSVVDMTIVLYNTPADQSSGIPSMLLDLPNVQGTATANGFQVSDTRISPHYGKAADISIRVVGPSAGIQQKPHSLGGFCITGADGRMYHFALPIYEFNNYSKIREIGNDERLSIVTRGDPFATAWLLTGITGPDFLDRNDNGMIDDGDWGSWVRFNYGRHVNDYTWRSPWGTGYSKSTDNVHESVMSGSNQLVYLNSIETRSHVALFLKSQRLDARSAATPTHFPLKLDEIAVVSKEHYKVLTRPTAQAGFGMTELANQVSYSLKSSDVLALGARDFIDKNAIRRVKFNHDYSLCAGVPNSSDGKLTLRSISVFGRNNAKTVPDFVFKYDNNPTYNADKWDGWGMYSSQGTSETSTHRASSVESDASAWSLSRIITPLGSEIQVNYERDTYASISGDPVIGPPVQFSNPELWQYYPISVPVKKIYVNHLGYFAAGDQIRISGYAKYHCNEAYVAKPYYGDFTVASVGTEQVTVDGVNVQREFINVNTDYMDIGTCGLSSGSYIRFEEQGGWVSKTLPVSAGGDIRVGSVVMKDGFSPAKKTRYLYEKEDGSSSGVVSDLPRFIGAYTSIPGMPQTPVMYGRVSVLTGQLSNDNDIVAKQVFEFETPHKTMYSLERTEIAKDQYLFSYFLFSEVLNAFQNKVTDHTSKIGKPKSIKVYDSQGVLTGSTEMYYTDQTTDPILNSGTNNYQGVYSSGVLMFDRIELPFLFVHKVNRTTVLRFPYTLKKVVNTRNGFTTENTNLSWDFYTGRVLEKLSKSPLGIFTKSVVQPAYTVPAYSALGPKALSESNSNRNMLLQNAATYNFLSNSGGDEVALLGASATTWNNEWTTYRKYNSGTQTYIDTNEEIERDKVWRISGEYVFKGSYERLRANSDGALNFGPGDEFEFVNHPLWQNTGVLERFDHFGMPLQSHDPLTGLRSATKMGYGERMRIAEAGNASYNEIAFSSAEDLDASIGYFGGEVAIGSGTVLRVSKGQTGETHTGDAVVSLSSGNTLIFKTDGAVSNKTYKASVWTNSTNGRIYYKVNQGPEQLSSAPTTADKVGNWYRIQFDIPLGASVTSLEIGAKSASGAVLFDDFRFQPRDAVMSCFVSNPPDFEHVPGSVFSYTLDNDNLFTKYEHNERGEVIKTYRESMTYGVKLISESKTNFRRSLQ